MLNYLICFFEILQKNLDGNFNFKVNKDINMVNPNMKYEI